MDTVDAVVIGAGAVGLACARSLARAGHAVIVLERALAIGQGVSSRSSEVLHAGLYYPADSLKARLCVQGRVQLLQLCQRHGVAHRLTGKLVVATAPQQLPALHGLYRQAQANGVTVALLDAAQAQALEPEIDCLAALWSPDTGIIDSQGMLLTLQAELEQAGGLVALGSTVVSARLGQTQHVLQLADGSELACHLLVNAASLHACALARRFQGLDPQQLPQERFAKGSYASLTGKSPFSHLVYPAPSGAWLGVHLTLDLGGQARFGPDHEWLDSTDPDQLDYRVDEQRLQAFYTAVRRYWPDLPDGALQPAYSGIRPTIYGPGLPAPDFRIDGPAQHGVPGLVNLFGIESPGLTSSMAIGDMVAACLAA